MTHPQMHPRQRRGLSRIPSYGFGDVTLVRGDRRCRALLLDFNQSGCAVRISDPAFTIWSVSDIKATISVTYYGETRSAQLVRLQRVRTSFSDCWILGMVFR